MAVDRKEFFQGRIGKYQKDAEKFASEVCGFVPDEWQSEVLKAISNGNRVTVRSGHGVGKTCLEAIILFWFLACFKYARVVATAPTLQQLNDVLWSEIGKWRECSPLLKSIFEWTKTRVYLRGYEKRWFAVARTASQPENIQGFHADNLLFIVDEASGVDDKIMEAVLATLSGNNNKLLMCGNPTRNTGVFFDSHNKDRAMYQCFKVSAADSPRTNKDVIASFINKYGEHSNVVKVRVYGDFPEQENDAYIPLSLIENSCINEMQVDVKNVSKIAIGVDVARYGDDETVIATNVDGVIEMPVITFGQNLMSTVGDIVRQYKRLIKLYPNYTGAVVCNVDDTGLGGGVTDRLQEVKAEQRLNRLEIVAVNFGMAVPEAEKENYEDITTYMWARVRNLMENGEVKIPNDDELVAQLSVRKYGITSRGKIQVEAKKAMKQRGIKSPDRADAVTLSCFTRNTIYNSFIDNVDAVVIAAKNVKSMPITMLNIGVSVGNSTSGAEFVATAIIGAHKRVCVLKTYKYNGNIETSKLSKEFVKFCNDIRGQYGRLDYCYCDAAETFLYRCIKDAVDKNRVPIIVRQAANDKVNNRIRLTTRLMAQQRLILTEECEDLNKAFVGAVWNENGGNEKRENSANAGVLNAFEYTIERESARFLNDENGG